MRLMIDIAGEPKGPTYRKLIDYAMQQCKEFLLVKYPESVFLDKDVQLLQKLKPYLRERTRSSEWPSMTLLNQKGDIYYFECRPETALLIKQHSQALFDWGGLEDLCFLKRKRTPWLITITHEKEAYFRISAANIPVIQQQVPTLNVEVSQRDAAFVLNNFADVLEGMGRLKEARRTRARARRLRVQRDKELNELKRLEVISKPPEG